MSGVRQDGSGAELHRGHRPDGHIMKYILGWINDEGLVSECRGARQDGSGAERHRGHCPDGH